MAKKFIRTKVPRIERLISFVILLLLVCIGATIAVKGQRYDPRRYALDPATLAATKAAPAGSSAALNSPGPGLVKMSGTTAEQSYGGDAIARAAPAQAGAKGSEIALDVAGLSPVGPTEFYNPDNLYVKIDGRAEGYLSFNFKALRVRGFKLASGSLIDVYEYDMGEPLNAYGIFSSERDPKAPAVDFAGDGYASGSSYFLRQGKFYIQVQPFDDKPETRQAAEQIARGMAKLLPADDAGLAARKSLPTDGMNAKSLQFILSDAFGIPGLGNVFQAEYERGGKKQTFFVSKQPDTATARKVFDDFKKFSAQFGKVNDEPAVGEAQLFSAENFDQFKVIYLRGDEVGGVVDSDQIDPARAFVKSHLEAKAK